MNPGTTLLARRADAPTALDAAYDMYAVGLYDYCRWALGDDKLASDALADTLHAAVGRGLIPAAEGERPRAEPRLPAAPHPVDGEPLRAWLFAVARAECGARAGSTGTSVGGTAVVEGGGSRFSDRNFPIPQLTLDEQWQLAQLRHALDELPPDVQEVAELAFRHGFSAPAVAAITCRPLRAVRVEIADAYAHLSGSCVDGVTVAFAVPPFALPPRALRRLVLESATVPSRPRHLAERHAPYARDGFPRRGRRRVAARVGLVTVGVAALGAVAAVLASTSAGSTAPQPEAPAQSRGDTSEILLPSPDDANPPYATAPTLAPSAAAAKPTPAGHRQATVTPRKPRRPAAAPAGSRGMSTRMEFSYNLATKAWDARITATVRGFEPVEVRMTVWWHDGDGDHRRTPTATRIGAAAYAAEVRGLTGPAACAQAVAVSASGGTLTGPVTGPAGYPYCG